MAAKWARASEASSGSAGRYRWVTVWLAIGCVIALLLLANAVRDYIFVSRLLATQQVRHQMTQVASEVEQAFRRDSLSKRPLANALGTLHGNESATLRSSEGVLLDHTGGTLPGAPFTAEEEHNAFMRREPLYRIVPTARGDMVIEAFAVHPPRLLAAPSTPPAGQPPRVMLLEVALPLKDADASVLTPIRRNLVINLAAALALLATVLLAGIGLRSYVKGRRLEEQVEIARQVQARLLPDASVLLPGVEIVTHYQPSEQVGGDFYDVFANDASGFAAVIGDVSGKGLPAALLMGVIHGAVRTAGWQGTAAGHESESHRLNRLLCERASHNRFASMFWCVHDRHLHSLRYVNAGHCPPFLLSRRNEKLIATRLGEGGPVLGLLPGAAYKSSAVEIAHGDLLVMYSDGLVEATNAAGEEFGEERLGALLSSHFRDAPDSIRASILRAWESFSPRDQPQDDLTFTIIRF